VISVPVVIIVMADIIIAVIASAITVLSTIISINFALILRFETSSEPPRLCVPSRPYVCPWGGSWPCPPPQIPRNPQVDNKTRPNPFKFMYSVC